jgi:hypothetical protein
VPTRGSPPSRLQRRPGPARARRAAGAPQDCTARSPPRLHFELRGTLPAQDGRSTPAPLPDPLQQRGRRGRRHRQPEGRPHAPGLRHCSSRPQPAAQTPPEPNPSPDPTRSQHRRAQRRIRHVVMRPAPRRVIHRLTPGGPGPPPKPRDLRQEPLLMGRAPWRRVNTHLALCLPVELFYRI